MNWQTKSFTVYLCFFLSGISALLYEVAWLSRIQLVMGHSIYALTTVICAFLSGLALGALFFPRLQKTGISCFWIYVLIEFLIGVYGIGFKYILSAVYTPYSALLATFDFSIATLSLIQFFFCGVVILIPTMFMGTTLPLLADYLFTGEEETSQKISTLYGINTIGACVGSFLAGYIVLPWIGYHKTMLLAAWINFLLVAIALFNSPEKAKPSFFDIKNSILKIIRPEYGNQGKTLRTELSAKKMSIMFVLFCSGAVSMLSQVLWNRLAGLAFGSSVYIFPLVTTIVLLGIALGSFIFRRFSDDIKKAESILMLLPVVAGMAFYLGTYFFTQSPISVLSWHQRIIPGFKLFTLLQFIQICLCLLPASILIGMIFPAAISFLTKEMTNPAKILGLGYALNIFGLIVGAIAGAFVLLPLFGIESIGIAIFMLLLISSVLLIYILKKQTSLVICSVLLGMVFYLVIPAYNWSLLTAGLFYNRKSIKTEEKLKKQGYVDISGYANWSTSRLLAHQDDPYMTLSIHESIDEPDRRYFRINGKVDGSNKKDVITTRLLALFPLLASPNAESVLTIGLGIGSTAAETLRYPNLKTTKIIEISEAMIQYAQEYFSEINGGLWSDPRVSIVHRDGREYLAHNSEKYDIIISEPSNPWLNGVSALFTKEFFTLMSKRLKKKGIACIWFHSYGMDCRSLSSVFKAVGEVFPSVIVFFHGSNYYLLAQNEPGGINLQRLSKSSRKLENELFELVKIEEKNYKNLYREFIKKLLIADQDDIKRFSNLINTDFYNAEIKNSDFNNAVFKNTNF